MALNVAQKKMALTALKEGKARYAEYQRDMDDLRKEGYGPSHCFHGTSLWVDYDPICGYCEDGTTLYEFALGIMHERYVEVREKFSVAGDVARVFGYDAAQPLIQIGNDLLDKYTK